MEITPKINIDDHKNEVRKISKQIFLILLPLFIILIGLCLGILMRDQIGKQIETHFSKQGLFLTIDEIGIRKYLNIVRSKNSNTPKLSNKPIREIDWKNGYLQPALIEFNLPFLSKQLNELSPVDLDGINEKQRLQLLRTLAVCELLEINHCFDVKNIKFQNQELVIIPNTSVSKSRLLLQGAYGKGDVSHFIQKNINKYLLTIKQTAHVLENLAFRQNLLAEIMRVKKENFSSYQLLNVPTIYHLLSNAKKFVQLNSDNYHLINSDFALASFDQRTTSFFKAYSIGNDLIRIDNLTNRPLIIEKLIVKNKEKSQTIKIDKIIKASDYYTTPKSIIVSAQGYPIKKMKVKAKGLEKMMPIILDYQNTFKTFDDYYSDAELKRLGFIISESEIKYLKKNLVLKKPIVEKSGRKITIPGPTKIEIQKDSYIFSNGSLHTGDKGQVVFTSITAPWRGILISEAKEISTVKNTIFEKITNFQHEDIKLTGAINFYRSEIHITDTQFLSNTCEDMLNIISSKFNINRMTIINTPSDAFDSDFSNGLITNSVFMKVGGDGFDVSGTKGTISHTVFKDIRDKAISVGEASNINSKNNTVDRSGTGIASKDRSIAFDENSVFKNIQHSVFASYVKKPEYGSAKIEVINPKFENSEKLSLVQNGSTLILNGMEVEGSDINIKEIYNSGYMKK
ncbi:MAG: right-handed parallel beta-helix repeat-containing protein [Oligoflexia bacterium]|nr:right-handed parallel beta-helix repeat-containing protein [Oligoflexia bacterium]